MFAWGLIIGGLVVMYLFPVFDILLSYLKIKLQEKAQSIYKEDNFEPHVIGFKVSSDEEEIIEEEEE